MQNFYAFLQFTSIKFPRNPLCIVHKEVSGSSPLLFLTSYDSLNLGKIILKGNKKMTVTRKMKLRDILLLSLIHISPTAPSWECGIAMFGMITIYGPYLRTHSTMSWA